MKGLSASRIVRFLAIMTFAVQFDDKIRFRAIEIRNVRFYRMLASKL